MKRTVKLIGTIFLVVMMTLSITACSIGALDTKKIEGTWGLGSIAGVDYETYCADNEIDPDTSNSIWEISGKTAKISGMGQTMEYKLEIKSNGFEVLNPEDGEVYVSVVYDESAQTLTYKVTDGTSDIEMVLVPYEG